MAELRAAHPGTRVAVPESVVPTPGGRLRPERHRRARPVDVARPKQMIEMSLALPKTFHEQVLDNEHRARQLAWLMLKFTDEWEHLQRQLEIFSGVIWPTTARAAVKLDAYGDTAGGRPGHGFEVLHGLQARIGQATGCYAAEVDPAIQACRQHAADEVMEEHFSPSSRSRSPATRGAGSSRARQLRCVRRSKRPPSGAPDISHAITPDRAREVRRR